MATKSSAFAHGDAFFAECNIVGTFVDASVRPVVQRAFDKSKPEHSTYLGALLRVTGWLRSLAKLNHPGDFQAIVAGSRALFEIAVDLTLLHHDPNAHSHEMLVAWEQSAKLKFAEGIERHYKAASKAVPVDHADAMTFATRERTHIHSQRLKYWPNAKNKPHHPDRWTGRSLPDDAHVADKVASYSFEEFYATRFSQLCWNTHGSGLAGVRLVTEEHFPGVSALGFSESARFSCIAGELVLRLFGKHDAISEARFRKLASDRLQARAKVLVTYPPSLW